MNKSFKWRHSEAGQTAVIFALMLIGLIAFVGLAVDGGQTLNERRVTQNAADSAALAGIHYIKSFDGPTEGGLQQTVNTVVESNGVPDSDGIPGNETNANIVIYYTDDRGNILITQPCYTAPCGASPTDSVPAYVSGLEVHVANQVDTYFLGVIGQDQVGIGAEAVAVVRGGSSGPDLGDNVLVAFGNCTKTDKPLDISTSNVDFIGGLHSATWFENRGNGNHYHGQVTYGDGYGWIDTAAVPGHYEPQPPGQPVATTSTPGLDPLAGLFTVDDFNCTDGSIGTAPGITCYDLTVHAPDYTSTQNPAGEITTQLLKQRSPDGGAPFLDEKTGELRPGLYYGGDYPFDFGEKGMSGEVTLVTHKYIKLTDNDLQLTGYMPPDSIIPGLLLYSDLNVPGKECTNHENLEEWEEPINTTGNSGKIPPGVYHDDDKAGCVNLDNPAECFELGSLQYIGLIYASGGRVATSGNGASYVGAIVAPSIRINGSQGRSEGGGDKPDKVGALFVRDSNLFPKTEQRIYLDR